jgi:hypothetical protein
VTDQQQETDMRSTTAYLLKATAAAALLTLANAIWE